MSHIIFLSYSTVDGTIAEAVLKVLEKAKHPCWFAPRDVPSGVEFGARIVTAIEAASVIVLIYSPASLASPHVQREISLAVSMDKPVIPVRIADVRPEGTMRYFLQPFQFYDALGRPIDVYLEQLPSAVSSLLNLDHKDISRKSMPWMYHLEALRDSKQLMQSVYDETLHFIEGNLETQGHLQRRDQAWLAKQELTANVPVQQVLAALSYGIDIHLRLFNIDFSLVPPGQIFGEYKNQRPFYLSQIAFTARALDTLQLSKCGAFSAVTNGSVLNLAAAEEIIEVLNNCLLYQAVSTDSPSYEASDLYWFRLPAVRELEFTATLKGPAASQRCLKEADLTATGRHPLGIAGLVGGGWQFCVEDNPEGHCIWGGTLRHSPSAFSLGVPVNRLNNPLLASPVYALRIVVEPISNPTLDRTRTEKSCARELYE